ncbi:MAG: translation initiation factor IF-3 [Clostridia bacterium]
MNFRRYTTIKELQINGQIRDNDVRLIDGEGNQVGIISSREANKMAEEQQLDLVKISPNAVPPVCKIMDYGKYRYEQIKKEKEARKSQKIVELKGIRLSMTIDDNDIETKAKSAAKFLADGDKVKVSLRMKGRQTTYAKSGIEVVKRFAEILKDVAIVEKQPLTEGRNIIMILAPISTK